MNEPLILSSGKREVILDPPLLNTAGFLGFGEMAGSLMDLRKLGGLVTNPVSLRPRSPARDADVHLAAGGYLLHSGLPNPGLERTLAAHRQRWESLPLPIILHLIAQSADELDQMIMRVERETIVSAVEVGVENLAMIEAFAARARRAELPVLLRLPPEAGPQPFLQAERAGAPALSLGPPRGSWQDADGQSLSGRYYGPSLYPLALHLSQTLGRTLTIPFVAAGGVSSSRDWRALLEAGASAVQLDFPLWLQPERVWG